MVQGISMKAVCVGLTLPLFGCTSLFSPRPMVMMGAYPQTVAGGVIKDIVITHELSDAAGKQAREIICTPPADDGWQTEQFGIDVRVDLTADQSAEHRAGEAVLTSHTGGDHPYPIEKEFAFHVSPAGESAWHQGDGGLWASWTLPQDALQTEEVVVTVSSTMDPSKNAERRFKPDYHCVNGVGVAAASGQNGLSLTAEATVVRSSQYPRLIAVIVKGGNRRRVRLFHPDQHVEVFAAGGYGENGPRGKNGGNGGDGGNMTLVLDKRFPELGTFVHSTAPGGIGGRSERGINGSNGHSGTAKTVVGKVADVDFAALPGVQLVSKEQTRTSSR